MELKFSIQNSHSHSSGTADIVDTYSEGLKHASSFFENYEDADFKTNLIGVFEGYTVYESYFDSGSIDYHYFAIKNKQ